MSFKRRIYLTFAVQPDYPHLRPYIFRFNFRFNFRPRV